MPNEPVRRSRRAGLRRIHRWLGIASLLFVLLLAGTGIVLNHASAWGLDRSYVRAAWILRWYGVEPPAPTVSFRVDERWATLLGGQLFFDGERIAEGISSLTGAVGMAHSVVISTADELFVLTRTGDLVERIDARDAVHGGIDALGMGDGLVVCRGASGLYVADDDLLTLERADGASEGRVHWSRPGTLPSEHLASIQAAYRDEILSVERLLADLHSGRFFTSFGPWIVDAVGRSLVLLGMSGLIVWLRGSGSRG